MQISSTPREAIQLNCFDYICSLPATTRSGYRFQGYRPGQDQRHRKQLEQFGAVAKNPLPGCFKNLFSDWINGKPLAIPTLQSVPQLEARTFEDNEVLLYLGPPFALAR